VIYIFLLRVLLILNLYEKKNKSQNRISGVTNSTPLNRNLVLEICKKERATSLVSISKGF
jgi:hypothetical protein